MEINFIGRSVVMPDYLSKSNIADCSAKISEICQESILNCQSSSWETVDVDIRRVRYLPCP